jgi:DUF1680 family protein
MVTPSLLPFGLTQITLTGGEFRDRSEVNRRYLLALDSDALLQNHRLEAGLTQELVRDLGAPATLAAHWGWESASCQLRGTFIGHWLSAAAMTWRALGDAQLKAKADAIVAELARCQVENGGEWCAGIPEKYLAWIARGKAVWAPQYGVHKTLMGLWDMYRYAGNEQALAILLGMATWFHRWTATMDRRQLDDLLDCETGGMLETWADLYAHTQAPEHLELLRRYDRPRLFAPLLAGIDVLTNTHANTTLAEVLGAARAFEVTGEPRWRDIVVAYWRCAVEQRGTFCTGGQSSGEIWTPPQAFADRLGAKTQEHCVVYNLIRLAEVLLRWTGEARYADFIELNLHNGTLAQQHPQTGMAAYYLPLGAGLAKEWTPPTRDFPCCLGTVVQAQARHGDWIAYHQPGAATPVLTIAQYIPAQWTWTVGAAAVQLCLERDGEAGAGHSQVTARAGAIGARHRPRRWLFTLRIAAASPVAFTVRFRLPDWLAGTAGLTVDGAPVPLTRDADGFAVLHRTWERAVVQVSLPMALQACPLPDEPGTVAFRDGPVVLAGVGVEGPCLACDPGRPDDLLKPDDERHWGLWRERWRTTGQDRQIAFMPLKHITDGPYTVYFPTRPPR